MAPLLRREPVQSLWMRYLGTGAIMGVCTLGVFDLSNLGLKETNVVMVYILGVAISATVFGRGPGIVASVVGVVAFDFFFTRPLYTLAVEDTEYLVTFGVMLAITMIISDLNARLRRAAQSAEQKEWRTNLLYELSKALSGAGSREEVLQLLRGQIWKLLHGRIAVWLIDYQGILREVLPFDGDRGDFNPDPSTLEWVVQGKSIAGSGTGSLPHLNGILTPLTGSREVVLGVLGIQLESAPAVLSEGQRQILELVARQIALVVEKHNLHAATQEALLQVELEKTRSSLLSSVSHDLRTPLASIAGASSILIEASHGNDPSTVKQLLETIYGQSKRLVKLVDNLFSMARIESGHLEVHKEWQPVEEVIGSALRRMDDSLAGRDVQVTLPPNAPLVPLDGVLIEQVLINLLENADKYSPSGTPIEIRACAEDGSLSISVSDHGPGIPSELSRRVFDKFFRAEPRNQMNAGLGLAICKAIVEAHGGQIGVEARAEGGAQFQFRLPIEGAVPTVPPDWEGMEAHE